VKNAPLADLGAPATSVFVFGVYLLLLGAMLVLAPNVLLGWFRIASTTEVWIRVLGMVVLLLGTYYVLAALADVRAFIRWTVPLRASVVVFFIAFVLTGLAPPVLILFGVVDLAGAAWTGWALLRNSRGAAKV
jgi:hypothetical protein